MACYEASRELGIARLLRSFYDAEKARRAIYQDITGSVIWYERLQDFVNKFGDGVELSTKDRPTRYLALKSLWIVIKIVTHFWAGPMPEVYLDDLRCLSLTLGPLWTEDICSVFSVTVLRSPGRVLSSPQPVRDARLRFPEGKRSSSQGTRGLSTFIWGRWQAL